MGSIDSDAHVIETPRTWEFMDEADRKYAPLLVTQSAGPDVLGNQGNIQKEYWLIDNRAHARDRNVGYDTSEESREMTDIEARLRHMDELEIDVQVLYPTLFLRPWTKKPDVETALCKGYNRWLGDIWKKGRGRLRWVALAPTLAMDKVRDELAYAKDNGACGVFMRGLEAERRVSDPYFHPLFEIATELDLAICFHAGIGNYEIHDYYMDEAGFSKFKLPVVGTFHTLIMEGVPARFPKLRWAFIEVSAQWVPYALNDLGLRLKRRGKALGGDPLAENRVYVACQVTDDLAYIVQHAGEDNLVVGTDYGHHDTSTEIAALRLLKQDGKVPAKVVDKILDANARALYALD